MAVSSLGMVASGQEKAAGTTLAVTFSTNVSAGTYLILDFSSKFGTGAPTITSISDPRGNTWTNMGSGTAGGAVTNIVRWCMVQTAYSTNDVITITINESTSARSAVIGGFSGAQALTINGVSNYAAFQQNHSATTSMNSNSTTSIAGDMFVGLGVHTSNVLPTSAPDTTGGAWNSIYGMGTTGASASTNLWSFMEPKPLASNNTGYNFNPGSITTPSSMAILRIYGTSPPLTPVSIFTYTLAHRAYTSTVVPVATNFTSSVIQTGTDDGYRTSAGVLDQTGSSVLFGDVPGTRAYLRFPLDVPGNAPVRVADLFSAMATSNVATFTIAAEKVTNSPPITSAADLASRVTTTASVSYTTNNTGWSGKRKIEGLETVIQEVVNQPGWTRGNYITLLVDGTTANGNDMFVYTLEAYNQFRFTTPLVSGPPTLEVTYTPPTATVTVELYRQNDILATFEIEVTEDGVYEIPWDASVLMDPAVEDLRVALYSTQPFNVDAIQWLAAYTDAPPEVVTFTEGWGYALI